MPPPAGPPPTGQGGRGRVVLFGLLVVVVVGVGAWGVKLIASDDDPTDSGPDPKSTTTVAPHPDALTVTEHGGAMYTDKVFKRKQYGYAAVVANRSDQVALNVTVTYSFQDATGHQVTRIDDDIYAVPAHGEMGSGGSVNQSLSPVTDAQLASITHFEVQVTAGDWAPAAGYGKVLASKVTTSIDADGLAVVKFEADSTFTRPVDRPVMRALYRNAAGKLVGATVDLSTAYIEASGHIAYTLESNDSFPGIDTDKTAVYVTPSPA